MDCIDGETPHLQIVGERGDQEFFEGAEETRASGLAHDLRPGISRVTASRSPRSPRWRLKSAYALLFARRLLRYEKFPTRLISG